SSATTSVMHRMSSTSHKVVLWIPTTRLRDDRRMGYEVTTADGTTEVIAGADTYQQEGPLTTFFRTEPGRRVVDCWSVRLASFRTAELVRIRRVEALVA